MKIRFDNQKIIYNISFSYIEIGVEINITFPQSLSFKNEKSIKELRHAILQDHDEVIKLLINKVAKGNEVQVSLVFKEKTYFDSFDFNNPDMNFNIMKGVNPGPNCSIDFGNLKPDVQEHIRSGKPFSVTNTISPISMFNANSNSTKIPQELSHDTLLKAFTR